MKLYLDADFSNSQFWPVNREVLSTQHTAVMVAAPFIVQPELNLAMRTESLMIGLGGGTIDMFVWHHKPSVVDFLINENTFPLIQFNMTVVELDETVVQVARKWYGTVDDERRHTVIGDGVEFMSNSSATGLQKKPWKFWKRPKVQSHLAGCG